MKIIVIGATGTIGAAVVRAARARHEVIATSRKGEPRVDIEDPPSVARLFETVRDVDAAICCAGSGTFKPLADLADADFAYTLTSKLMGQVHVIRAALARLRDRGSVVITTGVLSTKPMPGGAALSLVNGGLESFVRAAALEAPRGIRVNAVSPPWVTETLVKLNMDPSIGLPADTVAKAYLDAVEGTRTGDTITFT